MWQIPATGQAILAARIDRLPPDDKRLLQAASVIGKDVPFTLLQAIADMTDDRVRRGLLHLQTAEFLYETSVLPDVEYTFKSVLTHGVAYGSLLQDRRRVLHARIVEILEALYPDRLAEQVERLAHHALRGELWEKAFTYLRQGGTKALAHSAYREAATFFEQALTAVHRLPDARRTTERAIDLRLDLRQALFPLGELARALEDLREAEWLARTLDDPRRLGWVSAYMCGHHLHTGGHVAEVRTLAQRVETISERLGDGALHIAAQYYLTASYLAGDYRSTERACRALIQSLPDQRTREKFGLVVSPAVMARANFTRALAERGDFDEGDAHGREAIRIAESFDHPFNIVVGCRDLAYLKTVRGELSHAARLLERAVTQCREGNITSQMPITLAALGHVYAWSRRIDEGISYLQEALTAYDAGGIGFLHALSVEQLGEAYLLAGAVDNARACADRAALLARERGERGSEACALRLLGEVAAHHARPDATTAAAHHGAAMTLASELGMRPLVGHCHTGLGRLYRQSGNPEQAQEHLTTARAMYGEMGMTYWLEKLETG